MKLVIHAHALRNEPLSQAITGQFDEQGGTIGRSDTNTLALPDPERHVSRLQAEVKFAGSAFSIRNVGSANPIEVNGRAIKPGESMPLAAGDQLLIGGYAMHVSAALPATVAGAAAVRSDARTVIRESAGEPRTDPRPPQRRPPRAPAPDVANATTAPGRRARESADDPFADLLGSGSAEASDGDPFADLMSSPPASRPGAAPAQARSPAVPAGRAGDVRGAGGAGSAGSAGSAGGSGPARLPDDFDPFADSPAAARPVGDAALEDFMGTAPGTLDRLPDDLGIEDLIAGPGAARAAGAGAGANRASLDEAFGLDAGRGSPGRAAGDAMDEFLASAPPGPGSSEGDLLDLFGGDSTSGKASNAPSAPNHTPELSSAYRPPAVQAPAPPPSRPAQVPPPPPRHLPAGPARAARPAVPPPRAEADRQRPNPSASTPPDVLWQAFCEGAGVNIALPQGLSPELMRVIGRLMHDAIDGSLRLIASRAAAKQELRAQVTTIQSKHNNPLKFSADAQAALAQLLQPPVRGFMPGPDAVRDAMDDLLGHQIGTMSGTRAALQGMLKRFEPERLEARLSSKGVIDTLLPMNRRARLWELYVEHYAKVQQEAQEDFHELFGKAFVQAYEEQIDRLDAARRKAG